MPTCSSSSKTLLFSRRRLSGVSHHWAGVAGAGRSRAPAFSLIENVNAVCRKVTAARCGIQHQDACALTPGPWQPMLRTRCPTVPSLIQPPAIGKQLAEGEFRRWRFGAKLGFHGAIRTCHPRFPARPARHAAKTVNQRQGSSSPLCGALSAFASGVPMCSWAGLAYAQAASSLASWFAG